MGCPFNVIEVILFSELIRILSLDLHGIAFCDTIKLHLCGSLTYVFTEHDFAARRCVS